MLRRQDKEKQADFEEYKHDIEQRVIKMKSAFYAELDSSKDQHCAELENVRRHYEGILRSQEVHLQTKKGADNVA